MTCSIVPRHAPEDELLETRVAVGAHHHHVLPIVADFGQDRIADADVAGNRALRLDFHAMPRQMQGNVRAGLTAALHAVFLGIYRQYRDRLGLDEKGQRIIYRPGRLSAGVPGDEDALTQGRPRAYVGHDQRRPAGRHDHIAAE